MFITIFLSPTAQSYSHPKKAQISFSEQNLDNVGFDFDWLPDQDHGANLMLTLQSMVLQTVDGKDLLLPAWPSEWHVKYKLLSVSGKVVEGTD